MFQYLTVQGHPLKIVSGAVRNVIRPCVLINKVSQKKPVFVSTLLVRRYSQTCNGESGHTHIIRSPLLTFGQHRNIPVCRQATWKHFITRCYSSSKYGSDNGNDSQKSVETVKDSDKAVNEFEKELKHLIDNRAQSKSQAELNIPREADFAIIGGGSFGLSVAYWLKKRNPEGFSLVVIERDPTYNRSCSTLGLASVSHQFSLPENVQMSLFSAQFLREMRDHLSVLDLDPPDIQFNQQGYLLLAQDQNGKKILEENYTVQNELGANTELMDAEHLKAKFPWLNTNDLQLGSYGLSNEGWFDPWLYLTALKIKCMSLGVKFIKGEVTGFVTENLSPEYTLNGEVQTNIKLDQIQIKAEDGKTYPMKFSACVNCAGPWSGQVAAMAGIGKGKAGCMSVALPVEPRKRYVYVFHCPNGPGLNMPMLIDPMGVYVRREGLSGCYICGASPQPDKEPPITDLEVDYGFFEETIWPILAHRVPAFQDLKLKSAWAGFYDYNYFDQNLIIGNHPIHRNFMMATGCSGHGVQQSPAIGRAMAEYILDDDYSTIDLSRFSFDRILDNEPVFEKGPYII